MEPKPTYVAQPRDLHALAPWFNMIRRLRRHLRSAATGGVSYSVIRITVLVNRSGEPVIWTTPETTIIEPKDELTVDSLLHALT